MTSHLKPGSRTLVAESGAREQVGSERPATREGTADHASTSVISRNLEHDGIPFSWWAVDKAPSLVTVTSPGFRSKSEFTQSDPEECARKLAARILDEEKGRAVEVRARLEKRRDRRAVRY
jgi:hypothetical protein